MGEEDIFQCFLNKTTKTANILINEALLKVGDIKTLYKIYLSHSFFCAKMRIVGLSVRAEPGFLFSQVN